MKFISKRKLFLFASTIFLSVFTFIACNKSSIDSINQVQSEQIIEPLDISTAQSWFQEAMSIRNFGEEEPNKEYEPQWNKSIALNQGRETPVKLKGKEFSSSLLGSTHRGITRLIVIKQNGKKEIGAIIKYIPSKNFIGDINSINRDNFKSKKFDGLVLVEKLNGKLMGGFQLEKGRIGKPVMRQPKNSKSLTERGDDITVHYLYDCFSTSYYYCNLAWNAATDQPDRNNLIDCVEVYSESNCTYTYLWDDRPTTGSNTVQSPDGMGGQTQNYIDASAILGTFSANNPICSSSFNFKELKGYNGQPTGWAGFGFHTIDIVFTDRNGSAFSVAYDDMTFQVPTMSASGQSLSLATINENVSNMLNNAVRNLQNKISDGTITVPQNSSDPEIRNQFIKQELSRQFMLEGTNYVFGKSVGGIDINFDSNISYLSETIPITTGCSYPQR